MDVMVRMVGRKERGRMGMEWGRNGKGEQTRKNGQGRGWSVV